MNLNPINLWHAGSDSHFVSIDSRTFMSHMQFLPKRVLTCSQAIRSLTKTMTSLHATSRALSFSLMPSADASEDLQTMLEMAGLVMWVPNPKTLEMSQNQKAILAQSCPPMQDSVPNEDTTLKLVLECWTHQFLERLDHPTWQRDIHTPTLFQAI